MKEKIYIYCTKEVEAVKITDGAGFSKDVEFEMEENNLIVEVDAEQVDKYFNGELFFVDEKNKTI